MPVEREFLALPSNFAGQRTTLCGSSSCSRWTLNVSYSTSVRSDRTRLNNLVAVSNGTRPVGPGDPIVSTPERASTGRGSIVCWWQSNCPLFEVNTPLMSPPSTTDALTCYPPCFEIVGHVNWPNGAWLFRMPIGRGNNCHPIRFLAVGWTESASNNFLDDLVKIEIFQFFALPSYILSGYS